MSVACSAAPPAPIPAALQKSANKLLGLHQLPPAVFAGHARVIETHMKRLFKFGQRWEKRQGRAEAQHLDARTVSIQVVVALVLGSTRRVSSTKRLRVRAGVEDKRQVVERFGLRIRLVVQSLCTMMRAFRTFVRLGMGDGSAAPSSELLVQMHYLESRFTLAWTIVKRASPELLALMQTAIDMFCGACATVLCSGADSSSADSSSADSSSADSSSADSARAAAKLVVDALASPLDRVDLADTYAVACAVSRSLSEPCLKSSDMGVVPLVDVGGQLVGVRPMTL